MRDKLDWHASAAADAGQPEEQGFVHIACFLHWLGVRGWLEPGIFSTADRRRIADGSIALADLIALTDEQLVAEMATTEGVGFGEARYDAYLERWSQAFADHPDYSAPWTADTRTRATAILDELYTAWQAEGGLKPAHDDGISYHDHPEAEHLVPDRIGDQQLMVWSFSLRRFGMAADHPLLAGADPSRVAVAHAGHRFSLGSRDSLAIHVLVIPGRTADELRSASQGRPAWPAEPTGARVVDGIEVAVGRAGEWWIAWWFRDERLAQVMARTRQATLALVAPTDTTMTAPATVVPAVAVDGGSDALDDQPEWQPDDDGAAHAAPDLEALLPHDLGGQEAVTWSFDLPGGEWPMPPGSADGHLATSNAEAGTISSILRVPGFSADALVPSIDTRPEIPPKARRSQRKVGDRDVAWFEGSGLITAVWVRDGLLCTVSGYTGEKVVLEAIEQMP